MRLILLGSPGAGKGTQAELITDKYQIPQISTGNILRVAIQQGTPLGNKVKEIVESGQYVPDDLMIELIKERIQQEDCRNGFLLDGFPRTVAQADALNDLTPIDAVIDIEVPEEEIIKRLSGRRVHLASGRIYHVLFNPPRIPDEDDITHEPLIQRPDDREEVIRKRLGVYQNQTRPLKKYYQEFKNQPGKPVLSYVKIDGTQTVADIKNEIFNLLNKIRK